MLIRKVMPKKKKGESNKAMGFEISSDMMKMINGFTVLRLCGMLGMMNISFSKEELLKLNKKLNKIRKKKKG
jgi:hypothetical protein